MIKIDTIYKRGILFVRLYGVINKTTKIDLDKTLKSIIDKVGIKYMLINFENIYYINCDVRELVSKYSQRLYESGGKLFICGYSELFKDNILELDSLIEETKDEFSAFNMINI